MNELRTIPADRGPGVWWALAAVASLAVLIALGHGRALSYGLFMDDWAHFRQLRECGWSLQDLAGACRLELVGGTIELWWLPECTLRFFRPVAFGIMKLTYVLTGWSPTAMHAASLLWHLATCTLLLLLLRRLGASRWLAWAVAALFALHPAQLATVQWIACQTELMVTTFLLAAVLCWGRFRRWPGFHEAPDNTAARPAWGWALATVVLFTLALGCRENAVIFPIVVLALEPRLLARRRVIWIAGALFGSVTVVYLLLRTHYLDGVALPPRPYVIPPTDPDFVRFVFDKGCYYLLSQFLLVPCVPIGGLPYLRAHPLLFYGLSTLALLLLLAGCMVCKRRNARWLGPIWLIGFMLPVLPAFASPHHLYLPGIGWAVTAMFLLRAIGTPRPTAPRRAVLVRRTGMWATVVLTGAFFGLSTFYFGLAFETGQQVEDCITEEIAGTPNGLADGDTLYVANLPLLGHYAKLAVEQRTGRRDLRVIALTWAPRILGPATPTELIPIDERTIEVRVAEDRYFAGPLARLVQSATGRPLPDRVDRSGDLGFRVEVLARDADGIQALRFVFDRPLSDPGIHLLWGSRARWAADVVPWWQE